MPIPVQNVEELVGSPVVRLQWRQSTATRIVKFNWADRFDFFLECFPGALLGYPNSARMPGYPFLYVESIQLEPMFGEEVAPIDEGYPPNYRHAKATVNYRSPHWDSQFQSHAPHASDGPGGSKGSTKGEGSDKDPNATNITHEVDIGCEVSTMPSNALHWEFGLNTSTPAAQLPKGIQDKACQVQITQRAGKVFPKTEHTCTWNFVPFPPWDAIFSSIGSVNTYAIAGAPAGTLLFLGCRAHREYSPGGQGVPAWKLTYKFSMKNYNADVSARDANNLTNTTAQGWNFFPRPGNLVKGDEYQRLLTATGDAFYKDTDFTLLFNSKGQAPY